MGAFFLRVGTALKRVLSRAQMRLADRSDACEGPGWARTEHMQQESGYVGGVPKMAAGAEAFLEDAGCWQASLQNARELLEAASLLGRKLVELRLAEIVPLAIRVSVADDRIHRLVAQHARVEADGLLGFSLGTHACGRWRA